MGLGIQKSNVFFDKFEVLRFNGRAAKASSQIASDPRGFVFEPI
jgi:hypothetical protein